MGRIFISYRRDDAAGEAGRLYDRLSEHFGPERVFRDVDALRPGERFGEEIDRWLGDCDVLIALIGDRWWGRAGGDGPSRIDDPDDWVRLEIASALRRGIPVVPALLRNTPMPRAEALPPELRALASHHAIELDTTAFHDDVSRLIGALEGHVPGDGGPRRGVPGRRRPFVVGAVAAALVLLGGTTFFLSGEPEVRLRRDPVTLSFDQVRALVVGRGFYSAVTNPGAQGFAPAYAAEVAGGVPVVVDEVTGLMWEQGGSRRIVPGGREGAVAHVGTLNETNLAGFDDWRLPTLEEALSLLRPVPAGGFHLDPILDPGSAPFVWTSDGWTGEDQEGPARERGWVVYYAEGYATAEVQDLNAYVRAVRTR